MKYPSVTLVVYQLFARFNNLIQV
uniref:Uncharacterized protein n=1 Tax=Rhizophora mucronata TaxID=61149 RepID=A0A2P2R192_RHIMU